MNTIQRQDSLDDYDFEPEPFLDDFQEALTLSTKEIQRARKEALKVLNIKGPEKAFKIFTKGSGLKVENAPGRGVVTVKPAKLGDGERKTTVPAAKK